MEIEDTLRKPELINPTANNNLQGWGDAWVAHLLKCPTLEFGSDQDTRVVRSHLRLHVPRGVCLGFSYPLPLPCTPLLVPACFFSQINNFKK